MPVFHDQTGRKLILAQTPLRIISLVPSQTELLHDLGLTDEVVGITKFCIHPESWFRSKPRIGGTKQVKMDLIHQLHPDLIIANKEENVKEQVEELARHYPVWVSDVNNLQQACDMIEQLGIITGRAEAANEIATRINKRFAELKPGSSVPGTCYLIWRKPYMTIGGDTFIHSMLTVAGFNNIYENARRYPEITIEDLSKQNCQLLLLPSEPFPFSQKHVEELQPLLPNTRIVLVDGEMFSWYGSRLLKAVDYFKSLRE